MSFIKGTIFPSVAQQKPQPYFTFDDKYPQYVQIQRTPAAITNTNIKFKVNTFDPNTFLRSKAYVKVKVRIQKQERNPVDGAITASNYTNDDRIYKKPGMVLHNACTNATLTLNSHTMNFKDLRYITKKMNMAFAGKKINNNYFSTSGGAYEEYNGSYDEFGNIFSGNVESTFLLTDLDFVAGAGNNSIRFISDNNIIVGSNTLGFDTATPNQVEFNDATNVLTFTPNGGDPIDIINISPIHEGMIITFTGTGRIFTIETILSLTTALATPSVAGAMLATDLTITDTYETDRETARLQFGNSGGGTAIDLASTQIFKLGDIITLDSGETFRVIGFSGNDELIVGNIGEENDFPAQPINAADTVTRLVSRVGNADDGRQESYDDAFRDIGLGTVDNIFSFTEPLSFGPFNHLADYERGEIAKNAWNLKQSPLIPYVRELELTMNFKDIAANALIYAYGRNNTPGSDRECQLSDIEITSAELVLAWVKPRTELLSTLPQRVRIQSWQYEHNQFDLVNINTPLVPTLVDGQAAQSSQNNIYTQQVPSYILYYGMVNKDSDNYICRAVNSNSDVIGNDSVISVDANAVESGMHLFRQGDVNTDLNIRSNTLGGDDILDRNYNIKELYRLTLQNSVSDFPYGETKFRGIQAGETLFSSYPSEYFLLLGEQQLNSFFIRVGQLQVSNVLNFNSTLVATDGYSISKSVENGDFNGGEKQYALHIFFIYDRFYIELNQNGLVDSKFDSQFY